MMTALEETDAELARWRERLAAASRNVSELSELPEYAGARQAARGAGRVGDEARKLVATMDELWQGVLLIGAALDRAEQARAAGSRLWGGDEAARRAMEILRGPSITVDLADTPVLHRRLLAGPRATATVSPQTLIETMDAAFDRARERLGRITEAAVRADALDATLRASAAALPGDAFAARLDAARAPDPLDRLDALEAVRPEIEAAVAAAGRAKAACDAARRALAELESAAERTGAVRIAVAIGPPDVDRAALRELADWLAGIERTLDAGRPQACAVGLASWRTLHDRVACEAAAASAAAASAAARLEELRGRLGALRAKRRARTAHGPGLAALEDAARAALGRTPVDLDAASAAVAAFQAALAGG